jgi:hypothetical protein
VAHNIQTIRTYSTLVSYPLSCRASCATPCARCTSRLASTENCAAASHWEVVSVAGTSPSPRSRHTATFVNQRMFVLFGGDDQRVYNDLHVFDAGTRQVNGLIGSD